MKGKICLSKVTKILSNNEMKSVTGGSGGSGSSGGGSSGSVNFSCSHSYSGGVRTTACFMSLDAAIAFCNVYGSMGYDCKCYPC